MYNLEFNECDAQYVRMTTRGIAPIDKKKPS